MGIEPLGSHGPRKRVSLGLCTSGWRLGCVLHTYFPSVTEVVDEKVLEQMCSYGDLGQCSPLFCRATVKNQGRCNQAGTSRCRCR